MSLAVPARRPVLADLIARPSDRARAVALDAGLVVAGAAVVAALAQVEVPLWPAFLSSPVKPAKTGRPARPAKR